MALTKTGHDLLSASTTFPAANTLDVSDKLGGTITLQIRNQSTGPTAQAIGRVLIAHKDAAMPAAAAEAAGFGGWKQVAQLNGGTTANALSRLKYDFGPEVAYIQVRFDSATGTAPSCEAHATTFSDS